MSICSGRLRTDSASSRANRNDPSVPSVARCAIAAPPAAALLRIPRVPDGWLVRGGDAGFLRGDQQLADVVGEGLRDPGSRRCPGRWSDRLAEPAEHVPAGAHGDLDAGLAASGSSRLVSSVLGRWPRRRRRRPRPGAVFRAWRRGLPAARRRSGARPSACAIARGDLVGVEPPRVHRSRRVRREAGPLSRWTSEPGSAARSRSSRLAGWLSSTRQRQQSRLPGAGAAGDHGQAPAAGIGHPPARSSAARIRPVRPVR